MKINELLNEALPGVKKPSLWARLTGKGNAAAKLKTSAKTGSKAWIEYAKQLTAQGKIDDATPPNVYSNIFKNWAAAASNLPPKHPEIIKIGDQLAADLAADNSMRPIDNAMAKIVALTQSIAANPESRYTSDQKVQAIYNLMDKRYGKFFKDLQSKQDLRNYIVKTVEANTDKPIDELQKTIEANVAQFATKKKKKNKGGGTPTKDPNNIPPGDTATYMNKSYTWTNGAWRNGTDVLSGTDAQAATQDWLNS